jgi:hypothetical protein
VTDADRQWCVYKGDEDAATLPLDVLYAVHAFGYGVDEQTSLGHEATVWTNLVHPL